MTLPRTALALALVAILATGAWAQSARGIAHPPPPRAPPPTPIYRRRGVSVARFLARSPSAPFLAIHVFHAGARTLIFVIPPRP